MYWIYNFEIGYNTFLSLLYYDRNFHLNSILTNEVMPHQSCKIRCMNKTLFANLVTYDGICLTVGSLQSFVLPKYILKWALSKQADYWEHCCYGTLWKVECLIKYSQLKLWPDFGKWLLITYLDLVHIK